MKILLRHTRTGLYFQGHNQWTPNIQSACDFRFRDRALGYVETWRLKDVEMAFAFDNPHSITMVRLGTALAAA